MKTLGIIAGMSPESTLLYYQIINRETNLRLGGNHSADLLIHSVNFETIVRMQKQGQWEDAGELLAKSARKLEQMGADGIVLATNTMHKVAHTISAACSIPLLHIIDITADEIKRQLHFKDHSSTKPKIALLGTRFTMSDGFYTDHMQNLGIDLVYPTPIQQDEIHRIIFEELCLNRILPNSLSYYQEVIQELARQGAQGVILACTEIGLLLNQENCPLPVFDSTTIHAMAAVDFILGT